MPRRRTAIARIGFTITLLACALPSRGASSDSLHDAKKRVADALAEVTKAKVGFSLATKRIRKEIEATPEGKEAAAAAKEAAARRAVAVKAMRQSLRDQQPYQTAIAQRDKCQKERDQLRFNPTPSAAQREKLSKAAVALVKAEQEITRLEREASEADPKVAEAQAGVDEAEANLAALRRTFADRAKNDPAFEAAEQRLVQAAAGYDQANKDVEQAKQAQVNSEERRVDQDLEAHRRQVRDRFGHR